MPLARVGARTDRTMYYTKLRREAWSIFRARALAARYAASVRRGCALHHLKCNQGKAIACWYRGVAMHLEMVGHAKRANYNIEESEGMFPPCKNGRVVFTTVWLYQFHLWDLCCSNIILRDNQSSSVCGGVHAFTITSHVYTIASISEMKLR